ncbi:MAG: hypothetical protein P8P98_08195 [Emcibacteraceae bacterium]|nr:hypothetical protein [Emcibacteraceae bacterium]MDG1995004.1 hypothetical protein [Emcibacteraceae bacterium]
MKVGSESQTLVSLTSLLDASRQQQQTQRDNQQSKKIADESGRDARVAARKTERQELIQQNRNALQKVQDDLRKQNIDRLSSEYQPTEITSTDAPGQGSSVNLNLREGFNSASGGANIGPAFESLGQIVDIQV